mmetsp:Transcript_18460/g.39292  ORF Transcript_18460/g.39292 Transcript_18460/m.39292 type:complete len:140 (+) Transcript_18460:54-473(+)
MSLRMAMRRFASGQRRFFASSPVPLGLEGKQVASLKASAKELVATVRGFSFGKYFEEKYFWEKANVGPFFIMLFLTPTIYRSYKDFYWTGALKKLNTEEIISDRYEWLKLNMLQDEVEAVLMKQAPKVAPLTLGPSTPP